MENLSVSEMKKCTKCGKKKFVNEFPKWRRICKKCCYIAYNEWSVGYRKNNKEVIKKRKFNYYESNKEEVLKKQKDRYSINKANIRLQQKEYRLQNRDKILSQKRIWEKNKRETCPSYRICRSVSISMNKSLREGQKSGRSWQTLVGYTIEELMNHLAKLFLPGMTFENYGSWHIDHKKPICSFNITDIDCQDFKDCYALSNLQPLWWKDNLEKGGKYNGKNYSGRCI